MPKILIVVPSSEVQTEVSRVIEEHRKYYSFIYPSREYIDAEITIRRQPDEINYIASNADVIVARGMIATRLKKSSPAIPVVEYTLTTTDIIKAVNELKNEGLTHQPVALIGLGIVKHQSLIVEELSNIKIIPIDNLYQPQTSDPIRELLNEAIKRNFKYFIGGTTLVQYADKLGYKAAFLNSGPESIWQALTEAQHIGVIQRKEREHSARFETILDHSIEGIISTDADNNIIQINSAAKNILGIKEQVKGIRIEKLIPEPKFMTIVGNKHEYSNEIIKIGKVTIVLNKVATALGGETIGNVITFQDVSKVQTTEIKIRSELHHRGLVARYRFNDIIGESPSLKTAIDSAKTFASVPSNILIAGETGTGKELFAQSIHNSSERKSAPFVAVNCAAVPENLIESEFFGYAGGAFTGASKEGRMGFFELAHGGTLFLDEVSEIPVKTQSKLLRVIQEGEVMRIGHDKIIPVNVRIICAANKILKQLTLQGAFREDLFYRLAVLQLRLPALRDRDQDASLLADHFVNQYSSIFTNNRKILTEGAKNVLVNYPWEGNIRELKNICEQLVVLNKSDVISDRDVRNVLYPDFSEENPDSYPRARHPAAATEKPSSVSLRISERETIIRTLQTCNGNKTKTAEVLGVDRSTLWRKIKQHQIDCKILFD